MDYGFMAMSRILEEKKTDFTAVYAISDSIAIGACSHAVGTSKAIEIGETEGAMSGLAIGVCGIITVVFSMFL